MKQKDGMAGGRAAGHPLSQEVGLTEQGGVGLESHRGLLGDKAGTWTLTCPGHVFEALRNPQGAALA